MPVKWKAPKSFKLTCHYQNVINASDQIEVFHERVNVMWKNKL